MKNSESTESSEKNLETLSKKERSELRDYFAAKAMQGILHDWTEVVREVMSESSATERIEWLSKRSYDVADHMLKAREH